MKPRKKIPTAQEIIDEHLNGQALTEEMCREMAESLLNRAWIQEWSQKKGHRVYFECCGRYASDEDEPEMQELLLQSKNHREKATALSAGNRWNISGSAILAEPSWRRNIIRGIAGARKTPMCCC